jgi:AGZA family xanthine/uracil permease-like MFS transporter
MLLLSAFIFPVFSVFTASSVTSLAIFGIGTAILVDSFKKVDWDNKAFAFATIFTVFFNILTNSVSDGIGVGLILYVIMMVASKKGKQLSVVTYILAALFVVYFIINRVLSF